MRAANVSRSSARTSNVYPKHALPYIKTMPNCKHLELEVITPAGVLAMCEAPDMGTVWRASCTDRLAAEAMLLGKSMPSIAALF